MALGVGVPALLTLAGALTAPPHAALPAGRLIYLDADQPSEKTTLLRGLYVSQPGGRPRLLLHEQEPQDVDAGAREWILYPTASPDGRSVAFEKQLITLLDEKQEIQNQIWVLSLNDPAAKPRLLLDLTQVKLKQIVGLAWTPDSRQVTFLQDNFAYRVAARGPAVPTKRAIDSLPPLKTAPAVSATRQPFVARDGTLALSAVTTALGPTVVVNGQSRTNFHPFALSPDGARLAAVGPGNRISITDATTGKPLESLNPRWGWSVFGRRHVTSLRWSPDGRYLAYTVSKPPFEDELFDVDLTTRKVAQLPVRTGRAAWDWTR